MRGCGLGSLLVDLALQIIFQQAKELYVGAEQVEVGDARGGGGVHARSGGSAEGGRALLSRTCAPP